MNPALVRSAFLSLCQVLSLVGCASAPAEKYHLVPAPSAGAMIAAAPVSPAALRTGLSVDRALVASGSTSSPERAGRGI